MRSFLEEDAASGGEIICVALDKFGPCGEGFSAAPCTKDGFEFCVVPDETCPVVCDGETGEWSRTPMAFTVDGQFEIIAPGAETCIKDDEKCACRANALSCSFMVEAGLA